MVVVVVGGNNCRRRTSNGDSRNNNRNGNNSPGLWPKGVLELVPCLVPLGSFPHFSEEID